MMISNVAPTWDQCREHYFNVDGSLRDLYVLNTTRSDWQAFIDYARTLPITFKIDSQPQPLPTDVSEILALLPEASGLLTIDLHGMLLNVHFFIEEEIELDLDPREVAGESQFAQLLDFMRHTSQLLGKPVRLTDENGAHFPMIEVFPDSSVTWWHPDSEAQP